MINREIIRYLLIGVIVLLLQALLFKRIYFGWNDFNYIQFLIYPILIFILPFRIPRAALVVTGFLFGFLVDVFYNSPGVHASALTCTAFLRPYVLKFLEPRGGYNVNGNPLNSRLGINWYLYYTGILLFIHLFFYFSVETFTYFYFVHIWLKTIFSFIFSMLIIVMHMVISRAFGPS